MSKKWLLGACGALLAGSLFASTANAGLMINVQIGQIDGKTVSVWNADPVNTAAPGFVPAVAGNATTAGSAPILRAGQTIRFDIFANVKGLDTSSENDGFWWAGGNLQSSLGAAAAGAAMGGFTPAGSAVAGGSEIMVGFAPFSQAGAQNGRSQDLLPKDGINDLGGLPSEAADDFVVMLGPTGGQFFPPTIIGTDPETGDPITIPNSAWTGNGAANAGVRVRIGSALLTAQSITGGTSLVNFFKWTNPDGSTNFKALKWFEDGTLDQNSHDGIGGNGTFSVGQPVVLTSVPEPASLSVLALGAMGLLARRRK